MICLYRDLRTRSAAASGENRRQIDKPTALSVASLTKSGFLSMIFRLTDLHSCTPVVALLNNSINGLDIELHVTVQTEHLIA
jgi:hypothetical protein